MFNLRKLILTFFPAKRPPLPEPPKKLLTDEDRWYDYLYRGYGREKLFDWAVRLKMFRFCKAYGGHANDGDSLQLTYKFDSWDDLKSFCLRHEIPLIEFKDKPPQPVPNQSYLYEEYAKFPSLIRETQWVKQPGHCVMHGRKVYIWCGLNVLNISISNRYVVDEENVADAEFLEERLRQDPILPSDTPVDSVHCLCPKYYPSIPFHKSERNPA